MRMLHAMPLLAIQLYGATMTIKGNLQMKISHRRFFVEKFQSPIFSQIFPFLEIFKG